MRRPRTSTGDEAGFHFDSWHRVKKKAWSGAKISCAHSWRATFHSLALLFHLPICSAFGACWHILHQQSKCAEAARALEVSQNTVHRYMDLLQDLFMVRQLQPWHANIGKRLVKSPTVYFSIQGCFIICWAFVRHKNCYCIRAWCILGRVCYRRGYQSRCTR